MNHIGFSVPNLRATIDKVKTSGYQMITSMEATPDRQVKDDIAGPPPAGGSSIAFVQAPDDIKVELVEAPNQTTPIALHHVHFFNPANKRNAGVVCQDVWCDVPAWRSVSCGVAAGCRTEFFVLAGSCGGHPGKGRRSHRIRGEEPRGIHQKRWRPNGVKLSVPYRTVPALGIAIAFFTDPWGTYIELTEGLDKVQ